MLKNAKNRSNAKYNVKVDGCSCCNSKQLLRKVKHGMKYKETSAWRSEYESERINDFHSAVRGEVWDLVVEGDRNTWICLNDQFWIRYDGKWALCGEDISAIAQGTFLGITLDEDRLTEYSFK
jgi:hypothetical protein